MSSETYVVTGATGNIGKELVRLLLDRGVRVRALARDHEKLNALEKGGAEPVAGAIEDADLLARTFRGAAGVFAMNPPSLAAPDFRAYQKRVTEALASGIEKSGVGKVVNLSSVGAEWPSGTGPIVGLHDQEQRFARIAGAAFVHLRPAYFMENLLTGIPVIQGMGANGSSVRPDVSFPMIATRDIAARAAEALLAPTAPGASVHELHGPRDYTMVEASAILGEAIGKSALGYVHFPDEAAKKAMIAGGISPSVADAFLEMTRAINDGKLAFLEPRSARTTTPTTLETFARDVFAPAFRAS